MSQSFHKSERVKGLLIGLAMFAMGGCGLAYEYTLSKIASDLLGNSVRQWAIVIAVMLFFMGVGADLQKHIRDRQLMKGLIGSQILLGLLGGFGAIFLLMIFSLHREYFVLAQFVLISLIGLLIGFEIPLLTRINQFYSNDVKSNLARILKMDYIGALCGALLWVFLLPKFFTMVETGFVLGGVTLLSAALCLLLFHKELSQRYSYALGIAVGCLALGYGFARADAWTYFAEQRLYRDRIVFTETSPYQHIVLTRSANGVLSCYINGHLQFFENDEHIYHENLVHPAMRLAPRRERVLILGGGDGLAAREVLKYPEVKEIVLVDLDPVMTDLARENEHFRRMNRDSLRDARLTLIQNGAFIDSGSETLQVPNQNEFGPLDSEAVAEVRVLNLDAAQFVEQAEGRYDVIILDFPDPSALDLAKLYSQHFYGLLRKKLSADGIYVQQSSSPIHAREAFLCIGRTLRSAGLSAVPYHDNVPSFGEWGWWIGSRQERFSPEDIKKRLSDPEPLPVDTRYLTPELMAASLHFGKGQLDSANADVSTLSRAVIYDYYLAGWAGMNGL